MRPAKNMVITVDIVCYSLFPKATVSLSFYHDQLWFSLITQRSPICFWSINKYNCIRRHFCGTITSTTRNVPSEGKYFSNLVYFQNLIFLDAVIRSAKITESLFTSRCRCGSENVSTSDCATNHKRGIVFEWEWLLELLFFAVSWWRTFCTANSDSANGSYYLWWWRVEWTEKSFVENLETTGTGQELDGGTGWIVCFSHKVKVWKKRRSIAPSTKCFINWRRLTTK